MKVLQSVVFLCLLSSSFTVHAQEMNNSKLDEIFKTVCDSVSGGNGVWEFQLDSLKMLCITDQVNNRMRIISPVAELKDISQEQIMEAMEANFHSALDVKYAIANDIMWVAFIHPLRELTEFQVVSAVTQVFNARITFGTLYTSTELTFPNRKKEEEARKKKKLKKS